MNLPDFSAIPYETYSTKWGHRLSVLFVFLTSIILFVYVFLPWWHERDFSVTTSIIPVDYSEPLDISNEIDDFMGFINLRLLVASSSDFQFSTVDGPKCNITHSSYDSTTHPIYYRSLSKHFFELNSCTVDCDGNFGGYNPLYPEDISFFTPKNTSRGGCILPSIPNKEHGLPFMVADFQFTVSCRNSTRHSLSMLAVTMESGEVCDCKEGYRTRTLSRELTASCSSYAGSKAIFGYNRVRLSTYDRWGFQRKQEIIYQKQGDEIMNTNGWASNRYQLLLAPVRMEVEIRHTDVFAMLSRMAGVLGLMNVILLSLRVYNRHHMHSHMKSEASSKSESEQFIMSGNADHLLLSPDELELNISIAGGFVCYMPRTTKD